MIRILGWFVWTANWHASAEVFTIFDSALRKASIPITMPYLFRDISSPAIRRNSRSLDVLPMQNLSPHGEICEQRAIGLWSLATQRTPITILPVASALLRIEPADYYRQLALRIRAGEELPLEEVVAHLESIGYQRREPVEM